MNYVILNFTAAQNLAVKGGVHIDNSRISVVYYCDRCDSSHHYHMAG